MSDAALSSGRPGTTRLLTHLDLFSRLAADDAVPAGKRLEEALGRELAHTLVFALAGQRAQPVEVVAA